MSCLSSQDDLINNKFSFPWMLLEEILKYFTHGLIYRAHNF
jgi:hypothetical protein